MFLNKKFLDEIRLDNQNYQKIPKNKNNFFSLDSNIIIYYLDKGECKQMFENGLNLCISPTVRSELREKYKPIDFEKRVLSFPDLCSSLSLYESDSKTIYRNFLKIKRDTLAIKSRSIRDEMWKKRIKSKVRRDEYFEKRNKEEWIEEQDFRILGETFTMKQKLMKKNKKIYFVTHDMSVRKYVPKTTLEIVMPQTTYN